MKEHQGEQTVAIVGVRTFLSDGCFDIRKRTRAGTRSRTLDLVARVVCRADERPGTAESAAVVLDPPVVATTATGTVVVPPGT